MQEPESKLTQTEIERILKVHEEKWQILMSVQNSSTNARIKEIELTTKLDARIKELELAIRILDKMELPVDAQTVVDAVKQTQGVSRT